MYWYKEIWIYTIFVVLLAGIDTTLSLECSNDDPTDLVFIIDSSSNVNNQQLQRQFGFVRNIVSDFNVSPTNVQVGLIMYANDAKEVFPLNVYRSKRDVLSALQAASQLRHRLYGNNANVATALKYLWQRMFTRARGARRARGIKKIAMVLMGGSAPHQKTAKFHAVVARTMRKVKLVAVGIGRQVNRTRLQDIAGNRRYIYNVTSYDGLPQVADKIKATFSICKGRNQAPVAAARRHLITTGTPTTPGKPGAQFQRAQSPVRGHLPLGTLRLAPVADEEENNNPPCRGDICKRPTVTEPPVTKEKVITTTCGGKPADVVFILDSSSSIWNPDYQKQLDFVSSVIDIFDISSNMTRVGVMTFSDLPKIEFGLKTYTDKRMLKKAIANITHTLGDTYTADAIRYMYSEMFSSESGARSDVAHVAIIITDGHSVSRAEAKQEADKARDEGIHLITIGVGREVDEQELRGIANQPTANNMFMVDNYRALDTIKELLAIRTCEVTPTSMPSPQACGIRRPADIVFIMDTPNAGPAQTKNVIQFIKNIVKEMEISGERNQIALIPRQCVQVPGFTLNRYSNRQNVLEDLDNFEVPDTHSLLQEMRQLVSNVEEGGRQQARKLAILITDRSKDNQDLSKTLTESRRSKQNNIEIFTVGIGINIDDKVLNEIASVPTRRHTFKVRNHGEVKNLVQDVLKYICGVSYSMMMEHRRTGNTLKR